jgi:beta-barrel assembly-enhancing protease
MWNRKIHGSAPRPGGFFSGLLRRGAVLGLAATTTVVTACSVSTQQEVEMGAQYAAEINRQLPLVDDAQLHRYINQLGNELAQHGDRNLRYTFFIVNADMINAFAVPGGYIYINRGLIERAANLSEVAGVVAHEIGHVEYRHGVAQMERMQRANIGLTAAFILLGRAPSGVEQAAIELGGSAIFARYSREAEHEADAFGIPVLIAAGINPNGLVTMFQKLLEDQQRRPSAVEQWFSTHPTTQERIAAINAMIQQQPASRLQGLRSNTDQFTAFQQRMRQFRAPPAEFRR